MRVGGRRLAISVEWHGRSVEEDAMSPVMLALGALVSGAAAVGHFVGAGWGFTVLALGFGVAALTILVWDRLDPIDGSDATSRDREP